MKKLILVFTCLLCTTQIFAQAKNNYLKIHGGAELPVGSFSEGYPTGWGIHVTDYLETGKAGSLLFSAALTGWKAKIAQGINTNLLLVRIGYRIFAAEGFYFQVDAAGLGLYIDEYNSGTNFTYAGGAGYLFSRKNKSSFDISTKFNRISGRSWISLHFGYQFAL